MTRRAHGTKQTKQGTGRAIPAVLASTLAFGWAAGGHSGSVVPNLEPVTGFAVEAAIAAMAVDTRGLDDDPCWPLDREGNELVKALEQLRTRDARPLVWVMQNAAPAPGRLTLHLAIAYAETHGRVLAVSASGAAGLAQATPIAILMEKVEGPLFITPDYIRGAEAYYFKKPLGDADTIATYLLGGGKRDRAAELLAAAWRLRREGLDELDHLEPFADDGFAARRARYEEENAAALERLDELIETDASAKQVRAFRDQTRFRYRALRDVQRQAWRAYRDELSARRDALIRETWGIDEKRVLDVAAYQAGEILAVQLDVRFSPTRMAEFLSLHLDTKLAQAAEMGVEEERTEVVAIGLYNSGAHNLKRMTSGLIRTLPETDAYMRNVPGVRDTLEATRADAAR